VTGPAANQWPVQGAIVTVDPGAAADYALPASHRAFAHVLSGAVSIAGRLVQAGQTAWSDPAGTARPAGAARPGSGPADSALRLAVSAQGEQSRVMIYSGRPIREPVAMGGPFVMNKRTEIAQAFTDFHAGKFGQVPRQARLKYDR
jgi:redox-sensitive bicupin YhaK (pirin superfamily)